MGRRCCVPHCYTGYRKSKERAQMERGSLFKVPDDKFFRKEWIKAIARDDRELNSKDFVCYKHFTDDDFIKRRYVKHAVEEYKIPKLKPDAIPSIFPELPDHVLKIIKKRRKLESDHMQDNAKLNNKKSSGNKEDLANLSAEIEIKTEIQEDVIPEESGGPRMFKCGLCDYQSVYKKNVETHQSKHETDCKYECSHCGVFKTKWLETFRAHLRIKHQIGPQKIFKCSLCAYTTKVQVCLKRHMDRHKKLLGQTRYNCTLCQFQCDQFKEFQQHMKDHKELYEATVEVERKEEVKKQKLLKCGECDFMSRTMLCLKLHMKKHQL